MTGISETIGTRCEDPALLSYVGGGRRPAQHVGCPGSWTSTFSNTVTRCACACHQVTDVIPAVPAFSEHTIPAVTPAVVPAVTPA